MVTVVTRESKEEVMIFCYRQTDRQTLHHNIYIIIIINIITNRQLSDTANWLVSEPMVLTYLNAIKVEKIFCQSIVSYILCSSDFDV